MFEGFSELASQQKDTSPFTVSLLRRGRDGRSRAGLTYAYSLVVRILLIIAGEEHNPGPPTPVTITLQHPPYSPKDSVNLLIYCSDTLVKVNLSLFLQYSSHLIDLVTMSAPCR